MTFAVLSFQNIASKLETVLTAVKNENYTEGSFSSIEEEKIYVLVSNVHAFPFRQRSPQRNVALSFQMLKEDREETDPKMEDRCLDSCLHRNQQKTIHIEINIGS